MPWPCGAGYGYFFLQFFHCMVIGLGPDTVHNSVASNKWCLLHTLLFSRIWLFCKSNRSNWLRLATPADTLCRNCCPHERSPHTRIWNWRFVTAQSATLPPAIRVLICYAVPSITVPKRSWNNHHAQSMATIRTGLHQEAVLLSNANAELTPMSSAYVMTKICWLSSEEFQKLDGKTLGRVVRKALAVMIACKSETGTCIPGCGS